MSKVSYLGRMVDEEGFRAFIYAKDQQKIVNSWREFTNEMSTGVWFATADDVPKKKATKNANRP